MAKTEKVVHYQEKFLTLDEAIKDAKKQSLNLGLKLHVIESRRLFYVDTNSLVRDKETLHVVYEAGCKS